MVNFERSNNNKNVMMANKKHATIFFQFMLTTCFYNSITEDFAITDFHNNYNFSRAFAPHTPPFKFVMFFFCPLIFSIMP